MPLCPAWQSHYGRPMQVSSQDKGRETPSSPPLPKGSLTTLYLCQIKTGTGAIWEHRFIVWPVHLAPPPPSPTPTSPQPLTHAILVAAVRQVCKFLINNSSILFKIHWMLLLCAMAQKSLQNFSFKMFCFKGYNQRSPWISRCDGSLLCWVDQHTLLFSLAVNFYLNFTYKMS